MTDFDPSMSLEIGSVAARRMAIGQFFVETCATVAAREQPVLPNFR